MGGAWSSGFDLKHKERNTATVFGETPPPEASAHPRRVRVPCINAAVPAAGGKCRFPLYLRGVLLHAFCFDKKRLAASQGTGLFAVIRVIFCDSAILGEDF